jgi:glycosyltransferase involved in cell wall biosynthesis
VQRLREQVRHLEVDGDVLFPGFVPDDTLAALYSGALAVVVPSRAEGFGLSAVEAAACGAPVVASDLGPHRESLLDAALYFPPTDARALRDTLDRLLADEALRRSLAAEARRIVARLSWTDAAERLRRLLLDVARSARDG